MPARDPKFREDVLELDEYSCQICGLNGEEEDRRSMIEADHVEERGMGGDPTKDERSNGMTLCVRCHGLKHSGVISIDKWNRDDKIDGLRIRRNGVDEPKQDLWFYRKEDKKLLDQSIEALRLMASTDAQRARILSFVWKNYDLGDAKSPQQLVAGLGLDPNQSRRDAEAYTKLEKLGLEWPDGVNFEKVKLILEQIEGVEAVTPEERSEYREILINAVNSSYSDLKKVLRGEDPDTSVPAPQKKRNLYYVIDLNEEEPIGLLVMASEGDLALKTGKFIVRIDKVYPPLRRYMNTVYIMNGAVEEILLEAHGQDVTAIHLQSSMGLTL